MVVGVWRRPAALLERGGIIHVRHDGNSDREEVHDVELSWVFGVFGHFGRGSEVVVVENRLFIYRSLGQEYLPIGRCCPVFWHC